MALEETGPTWLADQPDSNRTEGCVKQDQEAVKDDQIEDPSRCVSGRDGAARCGARLGHRGLRGARGGGAAALGAARQLRRGYERRDLFKKEENLRRRLPSSL